MSALSSASRITRRAVDGCGSGWQRLAAISRCGRASPVWQPAQRFLDVSVRAEPPSMPWCARRPIRSAGRCAVPSGIVTVNVVPRFDGALDVDVAAVKLDELLHSARPMPRAFVGARRAPSTRWKRSNMRGSSCCGNADAGVAHAELDRGRRTLRSAHRDPALEGELERVGEQIEDDLLPHVAIDVDRLGERRAVDGEIAARALASPTGRCWPARA